MMKRIKRRWRKRRRQYGGLLAVVKTRRGENRKLPKRIRMAMDPSYAEKIFLDSYVNDKMF